MTQPSPTLSLPCAAILFDSDGVLVDSHLDGHRAWTELADEFDFTLNDATFASLAGIRPADSLRRFVTAKRLAEAVTRLEDLEVSLASDTPALAGARQLLTTLPANRWAIATSASRRLALARWNGANIPVPAIVVSAEDVANGKPDPEPYLAAAAALGVDPASCIVFEDSPSGGRAGVDAGMTVIAVGGQPWPFDPAARVDTLEQVTVRRSDADPSVIGNTTPATSAGLTADANPTAGGPRSLIVDLHALR